MKLVFLNCEIWEKHALKKAFPKDTLVFSSSQLTVKSAERFKSAEVLSIFIHNKITNDILDKLPKLKLITTRSTGFNHIDLKACKKRKIKVANVPSYGENTVAEHTFALILALSRKIVPAVERTRSGSFDLDGLRGFDLAGKTIGIVGAGKIGLHAIRMAYGFDMKIIIFDIHKDEKLEKKYKAKFVSLKQLMSKSDIITLHIPENKHTHHLINKKMLKLCKPSVFIVNTARGGIIDTDALYKCLKTKKIAGAALDVMEEECDLLEETQLLQKEFLKKCDIKTLVENHALIKMPNVIVTPHNAFNTHEALQRILDTTIDTIKAFKKKKYINSVK